MARQRSFDKDAALDIAMRLFWSYGYEATSVAQLTSAMGIRPPSLYAAFGDKRRLFEQAVQRYGEIYDGFAVAAMTEEPTARGVFERVLLEKAADFTDPSHPPGCLILSGADNCGPDSADVEEFLRKKRAATNVALRERIEADIHGGRLPADTDSKALTVYFASVAQGMASQARDGASRETLEQVARLAMKAWPQER